MLTAPLLEEALAAAQTKQPSAVIFDLGAVDFLASVGMGLLVATQDRLAPEVGFAVVADGPATSRPLTLIGVAKQINMHPTLEAAPASTATARSLADRREPLAGDDWSGLRCGR
jgi:anti-anti-sigma factor